MTSVERLRATESGLIIRVAGRDQHFSWRWLRDHGEDEASFNSSTGQRRIHALDATPTLPATDARLGDVGGVAVIDLSWPESPERTWISHATLLALVAPEALPLATPWHRPDDISITTSDVAAVLADDAALRSWTSDIVRLGFARLGGFTGGHDEVDALASRIGRPMSTIFGTTWELASDIAEHDDTAYTQTFLAPHTDGTYLHHAPRLQMFCCIERNGTGGESVIVDAFALAETLRTEYPADFAILTSVKVPGHYLEPGVDLRASRPPIRLDDAGRVVQVSMNNYDRSPMLLPPDQMDAFYRAYGRLHDLANDRARWRSVRLEAGDVLVNDNWRVLHGREAYTGGRRFIGCYVNHEDFESSIRTLGLAKTV